MRRYVYKAAFIAIAVVLPAIARSDNREVAEQIRDQLRDSGQLVNYDINVKYDRGTAWLSGRVTSDDQAAAAVETAGSCHNVRNVVNQLRISGGSPARMNKTVAKKGRNSPIRRTNAYLPAAPFDPQQLEPSPAPQRFPRTSRARQPVRQVGHYADYPMEMGDGPMSESCAPGMPCGPGMGSAGPGMPYGPGGSGFGRGGMGFGMPGMFSSGNRPLPAYVQNAPAAAAPARYDQPAMPNYAWPSYAPYPNYAALTYPKQYSPTAWPYIGPFYPYPQVPLGWRKVTLEWDDGWWFLDFKDDPSSCWDCCCN